MSTLSKWQDGFEHNDPPASQMSASRHTDVIPNVGTFVLKLLLLLLPLVPVCAHGQAWSSLTSPTANLSLNQGTDTTTFTWGVQTGSPSTDLFTILDTTGNTTTGCLFCINTVGTSTAVPFRVTGQGTTNGWQVTSSGNLQNLGTATLTGSSATLTTLQGPTGQPLTLGSQNNQNIALAPNGTGTINLNGNVYPTTWSTNTIYVTPNTSGSDICAKIATACGQVGSWGGIVDATGVAASASTNSCAVQAFQSCPGGTTVKLGPYGILTSIEQQIPDHVHVVGAGWGFATQGGKQTSIVATGSFSNVTGENFNCHGVACTAVVL